MTIEATKKQQIEIIQQAVELAIKQAAELSGLRNWLIWCEYNALGKGKWPNEELICQRDGRLMEQAFAAIIDPDHREFFESSFYEECDTEKGIFRLHDLVYESEAIV